MTLLAGFSVSQVRVDSTTINVAVGGNGPPLLLLHGYPQTHVMWHLVASALAERFTAVCPDLRGYGDSSKPESDESHEPYSKRVMAQDQLELMAALGFDRFAVVAHDRGARVARRLALDYPRLSRSSFCWTSFRPRRSMRLSTRSGPQLSGATSSWSSRRTFPSC
jgi:haloacetate dehalogenase